MHGVNMKHLVSQFKQGLFSAFHEWIKHHRETIGDKWYHRLLKQEKKAWDGADNAVHLIGIAMWMFNMISQFGILAGLGPNSVNLQHLPEEFDEKLTKRMLLLCSSCLCLQYLPPEIAEQEIPEGEGPPWRFRLAEYIQFRREEFEHP